MNKIMSAVKTFIADENGVTAIEYGLIVALVAVVIVSSVKVLGAQIKTAFGSIITNLGGSAPA